MDYGSALNGSAQEKEYSCAAASCFTILTCTLMHYNRDKSAKPIMILLSNAAPWCQLWILLCISPLWPNLCPVSSIVKCQVSLLDDILKGGPSEPSHCDMHHLQVCLLNWTYCLFITVSFSKMFHDERRSWVLEYMYAIPCSSCLPTAFVNHKISLYMITASSRSNRTALIASKPLN